MQGAFYATPILYPLSRIPEKAARVIMINPMAQIIQDMRYVLVTADTQTIGEIYNSRLVWLVPIGLTLGLMLVSSIIFKIQSKKFAERV